MTATESDSGETGRRMDVAPAGRGAGPRAFPYLLVLPVALLLLVLLCYPFYEGVRLSLTDASLLNPRRAELVWFANYADLIGSPRLAGVLRVTAVYVVFSVFGTLAFGMLAALAMNLPRRGRAFIRGLIAVPWAVPQVAVALIFAWLFNNQYGLINHLLGRLGIIESYVRWLDNPDLALPALVAITIWMTFPFAAIVILAALQSVDSDILEAASMDGARGLSRFRNVTLPTITPTLITVALFLTIWAIRRFEIIWILTQGGPVGTTGTMVVDLYRTAFRHMDLGTGATLGTIGLGVSVGVTVIFVTIAARIDRAHGRIAST